MKKRLLLTPVIPLLLLTFAVFTPSNASAAVITPAAHQAHFFWKSSAQSVQPARRLSNNLIYNGGPVQTGTANVYAIFWQPTNAVSSKYHSLIQRYFGDVGGSGLYHNNTQYKDTSRSAPSNSHLVATWTDTRAYPETPLLDSDIQGEVSHAQQVKGWSSSVHNIFFVFLQANEDLCFDSTQSECASNAFCAYHNFFGTNTVYAAMPYAASFSCNGGQGPNGDQAADETINVTSHEQMEAATDPLLNAWTDSSGQEIGDKCAWNFGHVGSNHANVTWNGHPYLVQQEWDNAKGGCVLSGP